MSLSKPSRSQVELVTTNYKHGPARLICHEIDHLDGMLHLDECATALHRFLSNATGKPASNGHTGSNRQSNHEPTPKMRPATGGPRGFTGHGGVEQVAVGEVFDHQTIGIAPVVEQLAALDMEAYASGSLIALIGKVLAARRHGFEIADLYAEWS